MEYHIQAPITKETAAMLKAGDYVYISGTIYTARDAAHKRMDETLDRGETLPLSLEGNVIYYMGPRPPGKDAPSVPPAPPPPAVWTNIRPGCWIWALAP